MNIAVMRTLDIVGAALMLGLILRWAPQFGDLIAKGGATAADFFGAVSLQGISSPNEVGTRRQS